MGGVHLEKEVLALDKPMTLLPASTFIRCYLDDNLVKMFEEHLSQMFFIGKFSDNV